MLTRKSHPKFLNVFYLQHLEFIVGISFTCFIVLKRSKNYIFKQSRNMNQKLKSILNLLVLLVLGFLSALLIYPIFLTIFIPVCLYKIVICFLVQMWDPEIIQIISGLSAILTSRNPYTKPEFVLMLVYPLKSKVDRSQVIDVINKQILTSNQFAELSQRIVRKFGYNFWSRTSQKITGEDHVHFLNPNFSDEPITRSQVFELETHKIAQRPFPADRSPWEIILVPNLLDELDPSNKSLVILRTHHCLMDGFTVINFMKKAAVQPWPELKYSEATEHLKMSKWKLLKQLVILFTTGPYHIIKQALFSNDTSNVMKIVFLDQHKKEECQFMRAKDPNCRISMQRLKDVQKLHNTNVSSILITLAMGVTTQLIKKRWGKVEKNMYLQMPYPIPGHPGKPTNHWTTIRMPIIFDERNPVKSLKMNTEEFDKIRNSIVPLLNFYLATLLGQLPNSLIPKTEDLSRQVVVLSNIPGPVGKEDIFGYVYDDVVISAVMRNGTAVGFGCISVNQKLAVNFVTDSDMLKAKDCAENEYQILESILDALGTKIE